jgi:hypothetical protein
VKVRAAPVLSAVSLATAMAALVVAMRSNARVRALAETPNAARQYVALVEARVASVEFAWAMAQCAEQAGQLPPTTSTVPASASAVRGRMYQSRLEDWKDEAYRCADFHLTRPQRFQYQWVRQASGLQGEVRARADWNGDGTVDTEVRLPVRCSTAGEQLRCHPDPLPTAPAPLEDD